LIVEVVKESSFPGVVEDADVGSVLSFACNMTLMASVVSSI